VHATTDQQVPSSDRICGRRFQSALVHPVLNPVKVHRRIGLLVTVRIMIHLYGGKCMELSNVNSLVHEATFREKLCYWCLSSFKSRLDTRSRAGFLTIGTPTCCSTITRALTATNSFFLPIKTRLATAIQGRVQHTFC